jgi:hypothetical protein
VSYHLWDKIIQSVRITLQLSKILIVEHLEQNYLSMPASIFEIIAKNWEDKEEVANKIISGCISANLSWKEKQGDIEISIVPASDKSLNLEITDHDTLDWYLKKYPMAKNEPEERIPYFVFDDSLGNQKHYSIANANSYLDTELIWKFASSYLRENSGHTICLNREVFIDSERMAKIVKSMAYQKDWCFEIR